jgi:hypothetical protein
MFIPKNHNLRSSSHFSGFLGFGSWYAVMLRKQVQFGKVHSKMKYQPAN